MWCGKMRTVFENSSFLTEAYSGTPSRNPSYGRISTRSNSGHCSNSQEMLPSFSRGSKVQVEYKSIPPGRNMAAAWVRILRCKREKNSGPCSSHAFTIFLSFRNIPSPEQGASIRILSKYSGKYSLSFPGSSLKTSILPIPKSSRFFRSPLALELLISFAISTPSP